MAKAKAPKTTSETVKRNVFAASFNANGKYDELLKAIKSAQDPKDVQRDFYAGAFAAEFLAGDKAADKLPVDVVAKAYALVSAKGFGFKGELPKGAIKRTKAQETFYGRLRTRWTRAIADLNVKAVDPRGGANGGGRKPSGAAGKTNQQAGTSDKPAPVAPVVDAPKPKTRDEANAKVRQFTTSLAQCAKGDAAVLSANMKVAIQKATALIDAALAAEAAELETA